MTACGLYKTKKEAILQLRSGLVQGQRDLFLNDLLKWIVEKKFAKVIVLTSTQAEERLDNQIQGSQQRFLASQQFTEELKGLDFIELEKREPEGLFMPGSGFAKALFERW